MSNRIFRFLSMIMLGGLLVQYALGMYVNLYVSFPAPATAGQRWEFAWSQPPVAAHIILAILLLAGALVLVGGAFRAKNRKLGGAIVGLLAILSAGGSGASFIPSQTDAYSYSMSLSFLVAFAAYAWAAFTTPKGSEPASIR